MKKMYLCLLILAAIEPTVGSGITLDYHNKSISDDEIARAIKPQPASVTTLIEAIEKKIQGGIKRSEISVLDVSENNLTNVGAIQLFKYIVLHLQSLEELKLSVNRLRDLRGETDYKKFEKSFKILLEMPSFKLVDVRTNYFGMEWYNYIMSKFSGDLTEKICW